MPIPIKNDESIETYNGKSKSNINIDTNSSPKDIFIIVLLLNFLESRPPAKPEA